MYNESLRNTSRPHKASSPSLVSKSTNFPGSLSSGKTLQAASSRCSRKSLPFASSSRHENIATPELSGELKEHCRRRKTALFGCQVAPRSCGPPSFPQNRTDGQDDQSLIQLSETDVKSWDACKEYGYDLPYVSESFQRTPGSPYYKICPLTLDEDVIDDAVCSRRLGSGHCRVDQPPAPPRSLRCQPPPFFPPVRTCIVPGDKIIRNSSAGSALASHERNDRTPSSAISNHSVGGAKSAPYRNALSGPLRVLFDWGCHIFDWVRSTDKHIRRGRETPVRDIHIACRKECERSHEVEIESHNVWVPDSWSTSCIESEDGDEESEVEAALFTPPLSRPELEMEVNSCCFRANQSCEEHFHLHLEVNEYEKLLGDRLVAPKYSHGRTAPRSRRLVFSSSPPSFPHPIIGLPPAETIRLISTPDECPQFSPLPDVDHALDDEGNIKLSRKSASYEALLSNHMHPRWRHYRFAAHSVAGGEIVYEEKVPVTYLDEGMVEMERLQEMSAAGKLQVKWGVIDRSRLSWM